MASVEIVAVGTELLLGDLVDTNTAAIAKALADCGVDVRATHAVGDNRSRIAALVSESLRRCDGVITTGGLGPTIDDLTKEAVADALGLETEADRAAIESMRRTFERLGRPLRENNLKQAQIPRGAVVLENKLGTAPGFIAFCAGGKFVASMPGVPREMKVLLAEQLVPWIRERFGSGEAIHRRVLHVIDMPESEIDHRIADLFSSSENPKIAVLAHGFQCDVKLTAKAGSGSDALELIRPIEAEILRRLDGHVYGVDEQTLPGAIHVLLAQTRQSIAVAESCTGGAVAAALTSVPGSSAHFLGGIVAYADAAKRTLLNVSAATLQAHGAVSAQTAAEMARGVRAALGAGWGIATTGVAGPAGGSPEKPVGLVWLAIADASGCDTVRLQLAPGRAQITDRATAAALGLLWKTLVRGEPIAAPAS